VLEWNIGLTNMVARASRSITDLTLDELRAGAAILRTKLLAVRPRMVCFNGKRIYEVFAGHRAVFGLQDETLESIRLFVMPSTSARTASYQRADKLKFFVELRALVDVSRVGRKAAAP
jgi:TDG/mug DNA glycosylase family protein